MGDLAFRTAAKHSMSSERKTVDSGLFVVDMIQAIQQQLAVHGLWLMVKTDDY
ncbi:MAG: hypothetical protein JNM70_18500 [Anaerolineae bacterium]|nr:hypothetical protein [Anaerolineae bacterium]